MISNSLAKMMAFLALLLFWTVTVSADINVNGSPTGTYSGGATATYSGPNQGGSGGGGGGGGISAENFSNIELKEKHDLYILKDIITSYVFTSSTSPIMYVNITGNSSAGEVTTAVEVLKNASTLVTGSAQGSVYRNVNIWVGTSGFASPKNIKEAVILFRVPDSWLAGNGISEIKMAKWDGSAWVMLDTATKHKDDAYTYFEVKTMTFGNFAITGIKGMPAAVSPAGTTEKTATTEGGKKDSAGFEFGIALIAFSAMFAAARR